MKNSNQWIWTLSLFMFELGKKLLHHIHEELEEDVSLVHWCKPNSCSYIRHAFNNLHTNWSWLPSGCFSLVN